MTLLPFARSILAAAANSMTWKLMVLRKSARRSALDARLLQRLRRSPAHRHVPDILGVFADGAVGREPRHPRHVEDAGPRPGRDHLPARVDAALRLVVGVEIRAHHVMVEVA